MNKIIVRWCRYRDEIIASVINTELTEIPKENSEIEAKKRREYKVKLIPLAIGFLYVFLGTLLFKDVRQKNLVLERPQDVIISLELIVLGIYALLNVFIFYTMYDRRRNSWVIRIIRGMLILLMVPYHICICAIKHLIKDTRQEHVTQFYQYYLISLLFTAISYGILLMWMSKWEIPEAYNGFIGFVIVFILLNEFFLYGKALIYLATKIMIRSTQRIEIRSKSKNNWRRTLNDVNHKQAREIKFREEWMIVKAELEYTRIYFYIVLMLLVLWIPKELGSLSEQYANQFYGIITIAALAREAKAKKE